MELRQWLALLLMMGLSWAYIKLARWLRRQDRFPIWKRWWWAYLILGVYGWAIVLVVVITLLMGEQL